MLRWRLLLGVILVGMLVGLCWLDHSSSVKGMWLFPVALVFLLLGTGELLAMMASGGMRPRPWAVYLGNVAVLCSNWTQSDTSQPWVFTAIAGAVLLVLLAEMQVYEKPGGVTGNVAAGVFAVVYLGGMLSFAVQLRLTWSVAALGSLIIVVKLADIGAYTVGRLIGRHKMAPVLSPGKTIEGAFGALAFACLGSWATFTWLIPPGPVGCAKCAPCWWGWIAFGLLVGGAGIIGDLAESLLKRDAGVKDSSRWMPGFGGVLDLLDSILLAAPVAWVCWALGWVGK